LSLVPLSNIPHFASAYYGPKYTDKYSFYSEGITFYLAEIWDYKFSKCCRYGLGRSPNLGMVKEANIWKFLDGCIGHATWQRECTMLTGKVLSAWVLLNKVYTYMHTHIIPRKPTPITLMLMRVDGHQQLLADTAPPCTCADTLMLIAGSGWHRPP